jgi:hypothetical protein
MRLFFIIYIAMLICGCSNIESFKKTDREMIQTLNSKTTDCQIESCINYEKVDKIPYGEVPYFTYDSSYYHVIDENNQVFNFNGDKSYVLSLALPQLEKNLSIKIKSFEANPGMRVSQGGFFVPVVEFYDKEFSHIKTEIADNFTVNDNLAALDISVGYEGSFDLPKKTAYILIHTSSKYFGQSKSYCWDGDRFSPINGDACGTTYTRPNIPEGKLIVTIH